jgi:hypothetical protein
MHPSDLRKLSLASDSKPWMYQWFPEQQEESDVSDYSVDKPSPENIKRNSHKECDFAAESIARSGRI